MPRILRIEKKKKPFKTRANITIGRVIKFEKELPDAILVENKKGKLLLDLHKLGLLIHLGWGVGLRIIHSIKTEMGLSSRLGRGARHVRTAAMIVVMLVGAVLWYQEDDNNLGPSGIKVQRKLLQDLSDETDNM